MDNAKRFANSRREADEPTDVYCDNWQAGTESVCDSEETARDIAERDKAIFGEKRPRFYYEGFDS